MRKLMLVAMVAGLCLGMSQDATANFFFPGQVIIVTGPGPGPGGTTGGTTKSARAAAMDPCPEQVVCECYTGKTVLDACKIAGVKTECLTTQTAYEYVEQSEHVIKEGPKQELGYLVCTGESNSTATVQLVIEGKDP